MNMADGGAQLGILLLIVVPAGILACVDSDFLVPYILAVWALAPEVRRISDWTIGAYQTTSLIMLAPLIASFTLAIPILVKPAHLPRNLRTGVWAFAAVMLYGLALGALHNGFASIFDCVSYAVPAFIVLYVRARPRRTETVDAWMRAIGFTAIVCACYAWIQYTMLPPWDSFWMTHCIPKMTSIGHPFPFQVRVFSSLNSPGPAGVYFAAVLAPMILEKRWRGPLGWAGVILVASALLITMDRSGWIALAVTLLAYVAVGTRNGRGTTLFKIAFFLVLIAYLVPFLPGGGAIAARVHTLTHVGNDGSYQARVHLAANVVPSMLAHPLGTGLGTLSAATKALSDVSAGQSYGLDNGYYALLLTFGPLMTLVLLWSIRLISSAAWQDRTYSPSNYCLSRLAIASLVSAAISEGSGNLLNGLGAILIWFFLAASLASGAPANSTASEAGGQQ
jgi:hypothetical protein